MIYLEVELKDDQFVYHYKVGSSSYSSVCDVNPDMLKAFTDIMSHCSTVTMGDMAAFKNEVTAKAWIKNNPEEALKALETK